MLPKRYSAVLPQLARAPRLYAVPADRTRNIGIIAHIDAGKTTTTERMLFYSGKTLRIGDVDAGDTVTDYLPSERERGITIQLAAISIGWNEHKLNIIDTPGHTDFTFEVVRSLRVLDGAVIILDGVAGVEAQTEKVWRQAAALGIPRVAYVNKMDRLGAGFSRTVKEIVLKLQTRAVLVNMPYWERPESDEPRFAGVVDVLHKKLLQWERTDPTGRRIEVVDLNGRDPSLAETYESLVRSREAMVEQLGELEDMVIEEFFACDEDHMRVSASTLSRAIRKATLANTITPVLCGLSFRNIGVQQLMDAIVQFLPSPHEAPVPEITSFARTGSKRKLHCVRSQVAVPAAMDGKRGLVVNNNPKLTVALAFKVITHPIRGPMTFFRVYSGRLTSNSTVLNSRTGHKLHLKKLMIMHGDVPEDVASVLAGNIGVVAGTHDEIVTGDTLVSRGATSSKIFSDLEANLRLHPIEVPPALFASSIEPLTHGDTRHMHECIAVLRREDPSLAVHVDDEMGQTILRGMGELHLEIARDRLINDMKARVRLRDVAVSYKETLVGADDRLTCVAGAGDAAYVELLLDSFEGPAHESPFAEEDGASFLDSDNNIIILSPAAASIEVRQALSDRRWKCDASMDDLEDAIVHGALTGLQLGGPLFELPLHSCVVSVEAWSFPVHTNDENASVLMDAARRAVVKALEDRYASAAGSFAVLEPIMRVKVSVESDALGDVVQDLNKRCQANIVLIDDDDGAQLEDQHWAQREAENMYVPPDYTMEDTACGSSSKKVVCAEAPLREMVGYHLKLRSLTQGRGSFDMVYAGMRRATHARFKAIQSEFLVA
ncbi:ribosome-releasing factor 2, mitochondrial [Metschnikowia bicuspidata]|uniref:Ribosome-releasing factor 2, mitochondrial n=1 Tax=Metschnikowia bicuspidata TaxID=27322 RepID=A0A4P9Z6Y5_9ASCO|nr:ribosome-releasing factor 2, mitochondrial [Metschnikowia bicuspidata]